MSKPDPKKEIEKTVDSIMQAGRQETQPVQIIQRVVEGQTFSGPLPPPDLLKKYNDVIPDGADRIMKMAEKEQRQHHRLQTFSAVLVATGQVGGFILALSLIGGALWLALKDKPIQAFIGLASGISLLYWGYSGKGEKAGSKDKKGAANPPKNG